MKDFLVERLSALKSYHPSGLDLGDGLLYPNYNGNSVLNIPPSLCDLFGIPRLDMAGWILPSLLHWGKTFTR